MTTNQSGYQLPNPQALDPYPIETALVNKLEPQYALGELNAYRADRDIATQSYQREVDAQHEQARKQLEGTMANNAAERVIGAAAHPELLAAMRDMPQFSWMFGPGINGGGGVSQFFNQQTRLQNANIAEKGASATEKLAIAGLPTTTAGATGITGLPTYMDDSINVKAAAARGDAAQSDTIPMFIGMDGGTPIHFPIKQSRNATPEQKIEIVRAAVNAAKQMYPNLQPTAGVQRLLQGSPAAPTAPSGGATAPAAPTGATPAGAAGTNLTREDNALLGPLNNGPSGTSPLGGVGVLAPPGSGVGGAQAAPAPNQTNLTPAPQQPAKPPAQQAAPASMPRQDLLPSEAIRDRQVQSIAQRWMASQPQNVREDVARRMLEAKLGGNLAIVQHPGDPGVLIILGMNGSYPMRLKK